MRLSASSPSVCLAKGKQDEASYWRRERMRGRSRQTAPRLVDQGRKVSRPSYRFPLPARQAQSVISHSSRLTESEGSTGFMDDPTVLAPQHSVDRIHQGNIAPYALEIDCHQNVTFFFGPKESRASRWSHTHLLRDRSAFERKTALPVHYGLRHFASAAQS